MGVGASFGGDGHRWCETFIGFGEEENEEGGYGGGGIFPMVRLRKTEAERFSNVGFYGYLCT